MGTDWAYIAGFLDGEGSIRKFTIHRDRGKEIKPRYGFEVAFYNTNKEVLVWIQGIIKDGSLIQKNFSQIGKLQCWSLQVRKAETIKTLLKNLRPYLKIKNEKANWLLLEINQWQSRQPLRRVKAAPGLATSRAADGKC